MLSTETTLLKRRGCCHWPCFAVEHNSKKRLLFDVSSGNIRGITSALFPDAFVEFESCGWLLMVRHKPFHFQEQVVFLVPPSTGRRIDMPVLRSPDKCYFFFYADPRVEGELPWLLRASRS